MDKRNSMIAAAARKFNIPTAFLEYSCPPEEEQCRPSLQHAARAVHEFATFCNNPSNNVAFVCALGIGMASEGRQQALGEPLASQWRDMVRTNRKGFGRKVA